MKKKGLMASFISVAAVWIGGHFGPGFATGTSMTTWFVRYGMAGLLLPVISMAITASVMYFMVEFARLTTIRIWPTISMGKRVAR